METKQCRKCGQVLPLEMFSINRANKDGLQNMCKECVRRYHKQNYASKKPEKTLAGYEPRELMVELASRGYHGKLEYTITKEHCKSEKSEKTLAGYEPRELMEELARRGYRGSLEYTITKKIDITNF